MSVVYNRKEGIVGVEQEGIVGAAAAVKLQEREMGRPGTGRCALVIVSRGEGEWASASKGACNVRLM